MRSLLLIALGFAILAVAFTAPKPKNRSRAVDKPASSSEDTESEGEDNTPLPAADKPKSRPKAARKSRKNETPTRRNQASPLRRVRSRVDEAVGTAQAIADADPVGMGLRRGESFTLGAVSDGAKGLGKLSDFGHDTVGNVSNFVKAATPWADYIPIVREAKKGFHDLVDDRVKRGKYVVGSITDSIAEATGNAAEDAKQQADERETKLRKVTSGRRI